MTLKIDKDSIEIVFRQLAAFILLLIVWTIIGTIIYKTTGICLFCDK